MHHVGFTRVKPEPVIKTTVPRRLRTVYQLINFRPVDSPPAKKALAVVQDPDTLTTSDIVDVWMDELWQS